MPLNAKQQQAVEYLDGPLLVLAGPGTGKTQLLSQKVAYILKNTDTNPENILCLTFTESGASNMRERLKSIIGPDALKVFIGTYHSFGTDILAQYKNYSEDYNRNLDSAIDEVEQYKIVKSIQNSLKATDILKGDAIKDIISTISSAKSANLTADELEQIADQNIADSEILSQSISPLLQNIVPRKYQESLDNAYAPIYEILKPYDETPPILKTIDRNIKYLAASLKKAIAEAESLEKIKPLSDWKDSFFEKDENGNYRLKDRIANKKLKSLAHVMRQYEQYLIENNLYDFDDMIMEAIHALQKDRGFKMTLTEKYQFILLDEFQDTNPSQLEIIKQLTDYEKPLIMAVGDDDQAIYEFQGASATNLTHFQEYYQAEVISLTESYRSTQEILDFSHQIIAQADNRFGDKLLSAHKTDPAQSKIERHEFLSSDQEYAFVAEKIASLIQQGVNQTDIAIIAPKHKYIFPLLPFLKSHLEIHLAYEKRDNLLEDPRIHEIITISKLITELAENKTPTVSLLEIMSYPFWNLPALEVIKTVNRAHNQKKSTLEYLSDSENIEIKAVADFLASLVARSFETPLEIMFDYILGTAPVDQFTSPFLSYYAAKTDFTTFELYENLATLRGRLSKRYPDQSLRLKNLIEMVDDYEEADCLLQSTSPYRDSADAIQILSAHKAKGLEFEYVFLIAADNIAWGKGKGNNNLLSLPKNLVQIRHTGVSDGERIRLLYVATTRSKQNLIITNSLKDFNEKSPERLAYLGEYQNEAKEIISGFLPTQKVTCHYQESTTEKQVKNIANWLTCYVKNDPDMRAIYQERLENFKVSSSALTDFIDIVYAGPQKFFEKTILKAPEGPTTEPMIYGNLIHKVFQNVTEKHISDDEAIKFFLEELEKEEVEPDVMQKLREKGPESLAISLKKFGDILRAENAKAEVDLNPEKLAIDGIPIIGRLDHINLDSNNKTIELYDFKTAKYRKTGWDSEPTLYKYKLQLGFYKLLLNASPTYSKYRVEKGHILFVTPDKDGEVYDKVYEFNGKDEQKLREILQAFYHQVKTLNFIDDKELFIPSDKGNTMKNLTAFIELLLEKNGKIS